MRESQGRRKDFLELGALFFLQAMAMGIWMVPLSRVLTAYGMPELRPYAFATSAVAAFISPLIFGAMADRHASPVKVLRYLALASAAGMALTGYATSQRWPSLVVLGCAQLFSIFAAPTNSIVSSIILSRLVDAQRQFGPVRASATIGWMAGCWLVSALNADASALALYIGAAAWVGLSAFTLSLPQIAPPPSGMLSFKERMGWDALTLLRNHDHRVVFIVIALFSVPMAAFYPFTPVHLAHLGFERTSALMTIGQAIEVVAMFGLARLFGWLRVKWIMAAGLGFGIVRFAFAATNNPLWLLIGIALHGLTFPFVYVTAQIYLNERIDPAWRTRAQALLSLMSTGIGSLVGYLLTGWWLTACSTAGRPNWTIYWAGLSLLMAIVFTYFVASYHGTSKGLARARPANPAGAPEAD